jgi:hypothetical protein
MAASPDLLAAYLDQTAAVLGLNLAPEDRAVVLLLLANLARVAEPLMAFELPDDLDPAPVFTPKDVVP